ncbi:reverse transcriptase domain-containing protein [Tanacetum coccineum]
MPPRMMTQSAGWVTAAPRGGRTGGRTGREGDSTRGRSGNQGNGRIDGQCRQVSGQGSQGSDQGNGRNQNGDAINDNIRGDVRNFIKKNDHRGYTYKELLACNPKQYDGKGGAIVYTHWIEKMELVQDTSGCRDNQKVKYTAGSLVGKALTWWNAEIHTRGREADVGSMNWLGMVAETELMTIQKALQIAGILTDEAIRNGSIKNNPKKKGNGVEPSKDRNGRDDNKRTRTGYAFPTTTNPIRRDHTGHLAKDFRVVPRNVNPVNARNPTATHIACYECGDTDHFKATCPRLNQAPRLGGNSPNQALAIDGGQGRMNNGIKPNDLGFSYEIEIDSGHLVEIDKVIKGYNLEIEGHVFDINLISFGSGSFDVIIRMDWGKTERENETSVSAKAKEQKQEELIVVRDFLEVFLVDLSGFLPIREIEFHVKLIPRAIPVPVTKSPYRLAPSKMEELSGIVCEEK